MRNPQKIILAKPRGFCAGVERAIEIVERVMQKHGTPIYVKHEIVHNHFVVEDFRRRGVVFIEDPAQAPEEAVLVYSAHGVSKSVRAAATARRQQIYDATCPLVTKVHGEIIRLRAAGLEVIMIGHRGHPEVEGTLGQCNDGVHLVENANDVNLLNIRDADKLAFVTQTTLSVDDTAHLVALLRQRFPNIRAPRKDNICYATQNRQDAVKKMATHCQLVLVVGSSSSSNSNRLCEVAQLAGATAKLIDSADDIQSSWLDDITTVGVTAGASAPEQLVQEVIMRLQADNKCIVEEMNGEEEQVVFVVPKSLSREATL